MRRMTSTIGALALGLFLIQAVETAQAAGPAKSSGQADARAAAPRGAESSPAAKTAPAKGAESAPAGKAAEPGNGEKGGGKGFSPQLAALVAKVQGAYQKLETLNASFSQTSQLTSMSKPRVDTGTVEFKKGGKMRWDFVAPEARVFVSDGKTLWIYAPKDKQVIQSELQEGASQTALNFMAGLGDLERDFTVSPVPEPEYQKPGMGSLQLLPRSAIGTMKRLVLLVDSNDGVVREAYVDDAMGTTTHIVFSNLKINAPIADSRFSFKPPAGVEVVRPQGF